MRPFALKEIGVESIMINSESGTVSTDYDTWINLL